MRAAKGVSKVTQKAAKGVVDVSKTAAKGVTDVTKKTASGVTNIGGNAFKKVYGLIDDEIDKEEEQKEPETEE